MKDNRLGMAKVVGLAQHAVAQVDGMSAASVVSVVSARSKAARRLVVRWHGAPTEAAVLAALTPALDGQQVTVVADRVLMWACGGFHDDDFAAWSAHEGAPHLTSVCGCGRTDGGCDADDSDAQWAEEHPDDADDFNDYDRCSDDAEDRLLDATRDALTAAGETFTTSCTPGEHALCGHCHSGRVITRTRAALTAACAWCSGTGVFDLSEAAGRALAAAADAENARLRAAADAKTRQRALPIGQKLP